MVAALALVLMAGTGRFVFQPLLRGPDADMLLHYVSLCFIWPCLVKRGGIGSWAGGLGDCGADQWEDLSNTNSSRAGACVVARQLLLSFHDRKKTRLRVVVVTVSLAAYNARKTFLKFCSGSTIG